MAQEASPELAKLRVALLKRGGAGMKSLSRAFRIMDDDRDCTLDMEEFRTGLHDIAKNITDTEINTLFKEFDRDGTGKIDVNEFIEYVKPYMSESRRKIVAQAFDKADKDGSGVLDANDLKGVYNARKHPKYLNGEWTEKEVFEDFLKSFEPDPNLRDGKVTRREFELYYNGLSANIDDDAYFDLMMRNSWKL